MKTIKLIIILGLSSALLVMGLIGTTERFGRLSDFLALQKKMVVQGAESLDPFLKTFQESPSGSKKDIPR